MLYYRSALHQELADFPVNLTMEWIANNKDDDQTDSDLTNGAWLSEYVDELATIGFQYMVPPKSKFH